MASPDTPVSRELDVVVFGASGFTGRLVVEYLIERYPAGGGVNWAIAGRNKDKLKAVLADLGEDSGAIPVLIADSSDAAALDAIAERTRVVLTTVGPYARHGSELVAACVRNGTGYCDLAGEVQWMRKMIDRYQEEARQTGARIVHACGFDSIPSDLGVWFLQRESIARYGKPCRRVSLLVRAMRGGMSGGTAASMINVIEEGKQDREIARQLVDPYTLNPEGERDGPDGRDQAFAVYNDQLDVWTSPFLMAIINQRIVRRTNAVLGYPYGKDFQYNESVISGPGVSGRMKALATVSGMGAFMLASSNDFLRDNLVKRLLPEQGAGPGRESRENGFFNFIIAGTTADGEEIRARVTGDRDPGYGSTSKMIAEAGVCLARNALDVEGGFWTPAAAMKDRLLERLKANAGLTFDIIDN